MLCTSEVSFIYIKNLIEVSKFNNYYISSFGTTYNKNYDYSNSNYAFKEK